MREQLEKVIKDLQETLLDLEKVETGAYGFKSAAPRARKALMEATKQLKAVRTLVQDKKQEHDQK